MLIREGLCLGLMQADNVDDDYTDDEKVGTNLTAVGKSSTPNAWVNPFND